MSHNASIPITARSDAQLKKITVLSVFGTRPEAIKMAPIVKQLENHSAIESKLCVTAQHRHTLDQVLDIFNITPDYDLDSMEPGQSLAGLTIKILKGLSGVLTSIRPDMILVHGDTTTSFAAALSAFYHQIPIGHVESGVRTYDQHAQFAEEMNRQLTGVLATLHFAPTRIAAGHLLQEYKDLKRIFVTDTTVIDAMSTSVRDDYQHPVLDKLSQSARLLFITVHRQENMGDILHNIIKAVRRLADDHADIEVVFPVHLSAAVQQSADSVLNGHPRIHLVNPLDVIDTYNLLARSYLVVTDSSKIEQEAPAFGVPVLVLHQSTERPAGVTAGTVRLAGTSEDNIYHLADELLTNAEQHHVISIAKNPNGDAHASERIVQSILHYFGKNEPPAAW